MAITYNVSNAMMRGALRLFSHWRIEGTEGVPPRGRLLVVSNHMSNLDPPLLAASVPRRLHYLAKRGLFRTPLLGAFMRAYGAFPIYRDSRDVQGLQWGLRILEQDKALAIFPEGGRSPGKMKRAVTAGVAWLALRTQSPILPIAISGSEKVKAIWQVAFPRGDITVRIGRPFSLPVLEGKVDREQLEAFTTLIMERIAEMLPENYHGDYSYIGHPVGSSSQIPEEA